MKNILIRIADLNTSDPEIDCLGEIVVQNKGKIILKEKFIMCFHSISISAYEKQWQRGLERIKTHDTSWLIANSQDLNTTHPLVELWKLYKLNNKIYVQNQIFFQSFKGFKLPN